MNRDLSIAAVVASALHLGAFVALSQVTPPRPETAPVSEMTVELEAEPLTREAVEEASAGDPIAEAIESERAQVESSSAVPTTPTMSEQLEATTLVDATSTAAPVAATEAGARPVSVPPTVVTPSATSTPNVPIPPLATQERSSQTRTTPPRVTERVSPVYPRVARRRGHEGTVELLAHICPDGTCNDVRIVRSSGRESLDRAAENAVRQWTFRPARRGGRAVAEWIEIPVEFRLHD